MVKSRLPNAVLAKIWRLSDVDQGIENKDHWLLKVNGPLKVDYWRSMDYWRSIDHWRSIHHWWCFFSSDGALDIDEFALAMHLIHIKLDNYDLPDELPEHLIFQTPMGRGLMVQYIIVYIRCRLYRPKGYTGHFDRFTRKNSICHLYMYCWQAYFY